MKKKKDKSPKLAQREVSLQGHTVAVGLSGDVGYISIEDQNLYPDGDSRQERRNLNHHLMMIPLLTREDLKSLKTCIKEVLKHAK